MPGYWDDDMPHDDDDARASMGFADPGGESALRAGGPGNPRNLPCPTCGEPCRLTQKDVDLKYQCDSCADQDEWGC